MALDLRDLNSMAITVELCKVNKLCKSNACICALFYLTLLCLAMGGGGVTSVLKPYLLNLVGEF